MNTFQRPDTRRGNAYPKVCLEDTELYGFRSRFVDQEYQIQVSLPPSHSDPSKSFPVLYLLDADRSFGMAKDILGWLNWAQEVPELIIVGIAYSEGTAQWWQKRARDYTPSKDSTQIWGEWPQAGGGEAFLQFIAQELIPFVETTFRTRGNDQAIAGLSFGALFVAHVLLTQPDLFNRYIMISPPFLWDNKAIFKHEEAFSRRHDTLHASVYSAVGELDDREKLIVPWHEFFAILENRNYKGLRLRKEMVVGETHISVYPVGFTRGLKHIFSGA